LAKAKDALRRLGESFLKADPTRFNMAGTQQAELAFEAVSALIDAGIHEFKAIAIKVSELAKQYINIPGFKEAIEDIYDAYTDVDENIPKREQTFDSIIKSSEKSVKEEQKDDNSIQTGKALASVETEDGSGVQKEGDTRSESARRSGTRSGADGSNDRKGEYGGGSSRGDSSSDAGTGERSRVADTASEEYVPSEIPDKVDSTGLNYLIGESDNIGVGGQATKADETIRAIETLKEIESANRKATLEEQKTLAKMFPVGR
jgi:hypothetical protein